MEKEFLIKRTEMYLAIVLIASGSLMGGFVTGMMQHEANVRYSPCSYYCTKKGYNDYTENAAACFCKGDRE